MAKMGLIIKVQLGENYKNHTFKEYHVVTEILKNLISCLGIIIIIIKTA